MTVQGPVKEQQPDGLSHGGLLQPQVLVPRVPLREPQALGCVADTPNNRLGHTGHTRTLFWGTHSHQNMQMHGHRDPRHKKNVSRRPTEQDMPRMAQNNLGGGYSGINLNNDVPPPYGTAPPPNRHHHHHHHGPGHVAM